MIPRDTDPERALLGCILVTPSTFDDDAATVRPDMFARRIHGAAFEVLQETIEGGGTPDVVLLTRGLEARGIATKEAALFASDLLRETATSANAGLYARMVVESHIRRTVRRVTSDLLRDIDEVSADPFDLIGRTEADLVALIDRAEGSRTRRIDAVLSEVLTEVEEIQRKRKADPDGIGGIPSGLRALDERFDGWKPGHLVTLAARPSVGKTTLALQLARAAAIEGCPVLVQSLEMPDAQLAARLLSGVSGIHSRKLLRGHVEDHEIDFARLSGEKVDRLPIWVDDSPTVTVRQIWSRARVAVRRHGIRFLVVDYLQLIEPEARTQRRGRHEQVDIIAKGLKRIARDLSITVLTLSQLNREVEKRSKTRRPQLSDLKESGGIEEASDAVLFLYRPHLYPDDPNRADDAGRLRPEGYTEVITAKNRHGAIGIDELRFHPSTFEFRDPPHFVAAVGSADSVEPF